jgi:hypothetical protein
MNSLVELKAQSRALSNGILNPANLHEALEIAGVLCKSSLIPKDFQGNPGNVLVAIQWGMELGLAPMQALQSIAVINGRPSLWGDAVIALCKSHSVCEWVREYFDDDGTAVCVAQRRGDPDPVERRFSLEDAKRAGLAGKAGPWSQYPRRMLQMRARSWCLRDAFPDLLRGMAVAEEQADIPPAVTVTVSESPGAHQPVLSRTDQAKAKLLQRRAAPPESLPPHDPETGEILSAAPEADPIADLLLALNECQSVEDLERYRGAIAELKNGQKGRAVAAWKAKKAQLAGIVDAPAPAQ